MGENDFKKISKFTDLVAWQEAHKLVLMIYKISKNFPTEELYGLVNQLRRAVVSITSNIAEGFGRRSSKDKNSFYTKALTSLIEVQNQLIISKDVGYITKETFIRIAKQAVVVHKLINGLIKSTRTQDYKS